MTLAFLFVQINRHFSENAKPEMTIEKLQKIATSQVEPKYKARWLRWWNSSSSGRQSYRFPLAGAGEFIWDTWLNKATFWAEVM